MSTYWANFIKAGDPNGPGLPGWPRYETDRPQRMQIGLRSGAGPDPDAAKFMVLKAIHDRRDPPEPAFRRL